LRPENEEGEMTAKVVSLDNIRQNREWRENFDRIRPFYDALWNAEGDEAPTALFRLARKRRDLLAEGIGTPRAVRDMLRFEAWQKDIPPDEAEKIISAGLYRARGAGMARQ
jgi:hypothetical protein